MFEPQPLKVETRRGEVQLLLEPFCTLDLKELDALFKVHLEEYRTSETFDPNYEWYRQRAEAGRIAFIIARQEGKAVGYLVFRIDPSAYSRNFSATEELWYIIPKLRGTTLARRMIEYFEYCARGLGLEELYMGYSSKSASALFRRAGLEPFAVVFGKALSYAKSFQLSA